LTRVESARRRAIVKRARELLPELSDAALYRITALLERVLAVPQVDPKAYDLLEKALRRPTPKR
jgi:hypothetical protein